MSGSGGVPRVYNIPAGTPFLPSLARAVLARGFPESSGLPPGPFDLPRWTILLPTRRSVRELADVFARADGGIGRLLPRIRALGDVDEAEFAFVPPPDVDDTDLPPAISPSGASFLLAGLIAEWAADNPGHQLAAAVAGFPGRIFALAASLVRLVDGFALENVDLDMLENLTGGDFAGHRQEMLEFLAIVRRRLPAELARRGVMGAAERRSRLMEREAARLEAGFHPGPIIAAGSTGSLPATARLLNVISRLPNGAVVLPGLDLAMEEESWNVVENEPTHPQYASKGLLSTLGITRGLVQPFPDCVEDEAGTARRWLAREIMRPSATTERWKGALALGEAQVRQAMQRVEIFAGVDRREEAGVIALVMRQALEVPGRTASLVTPDRRLARRVKAELRRWRIEVNDSAGEPLLYTPPGSFLRLVLDLALSRFAPVALAAALKHPLARLGGARAEMEKLTADLEIGLMRGVPVPIGIASLKSLLAGRRTAPAGDPKARHRLHPSILRLADADWRVMEIFLSRLEELAATAAVFASDTPQPLDRLLDAHLRMAEELATDEQGEEGIWRGEAGEALAAALTALVEHAAEAPPLLPADYAALFATEIETWPVRPRHDDHPRLRILGLLEARLLSSDVTILGGLNQGVWPGEPQTDPWLSRPMKHELGLGPPERRIGLSAHDFVQRFSTGDVVLTYARKIDGAPATPSRWILRLEALLAAAGVDRSAHAASPWHAIARALSSPSAPIRIPPPHPAPPVAARPRRLSVTAIETLINNPYRVYAERILDLRPLDPLAPAADAAERGTLVHEALRRFQECVDAKVGADGLDVLLSCGRDVFAPFMADPRVTGFWWPRFERLARWFIADEMANQAPTIGRLHECDARLAVDLGDDEFIVTARADRIDRLADGTLRIVDYKTGALPSQKDVAAGFHPQLPLEAWLAGEGAFSGLGPAPAVELVYLRLSGGLPAGERRSANVRTPAARLAASAGAGVRRLLADYGRPDVAYVALGADDRTAVAGDVDHLARTGEWLLNAFDEASP